MNTILWKNKKVASQTINRDRVWILCSVMSKASGWGFISRSLIFYPEVHVFFWNDKLHYSASFLGKRIMNTLTTKKVVSQHKTIHQKAEPCNMKFPQKITFIYKKVFHKSQYPWECFAMVNLDGNIILEMNVQLL